jgi:hypothetical protein
MKETSSNPQKTGDASPPGHDWNSGASRRQFLVSTGKAGALTILGLHSLKVEVVAATGSGAPTM